MTTDNSNKKDLQNQVKDFDTKIENITKRIGVMQVELDTLNATAETRSQAIQSAMVNGADIQKDLDMQRSDKAKAEQLAGAITQAADTLKHLQADRGLRAFDFGLIEVLTANDEVDKQVLKCFAALHAAFAEFEKIKPLHEKSLVVGESHNIKTDLINETQQTRTVTLFLKDFFRDTHHRILSAEDGYKNYFGAIK